MKCIFTADVGTQSLRTMLFDLRGNIIAAERIPYQPHTTPRPGWAEQDTAVYWNALREACAALKTRAPEAFAGIAGVGLSSLRATTVLSDEDGNALRPAIVWLDNRSARGTFHPNRLVRSALHAAGVYDAVVEVQSSCKLNWLRENEAKNWDAAWKVFFLSGWLIFKLTGVPCDTASSMVGYVPFVNKKRAWAGRHSFEQRLMPLEPEKQHDVVESGSVIGRITKQAAAETGLPEGVPLVGCGSDKACETIGGGIVNSSRASLSFGTTATVEVCSKKYFEYKKLFPAYCGIVPGTWLSEFEIFRGYWMIRWFRDELGYEERMEAASSGIIPEALIDRLLKASPPGGRGLMLQPYWGASVFDRFAKGTIIGFGDVHGRQDMYRAIIEGLAYSLRDGLEMIEAKGSLCCESVAASGGASQSDHICQITADIVGRPLVRGTTPETSSLGAAIVTAAGIGEYGSIEESARRMVACQKEFTPNPEYRELYDGLFGVYKKIYPALKHIYKDVQRITDYPEEKKMNEPA